MNVNDAFPSKYIKASDLRGSAVPVTISHVDMEDVGQGAKKERKPVLYFAGKDKGFVLNKTNSKRIADLLGSSETDDWAGQKIALYPTETEFQGETVECIRIKAALGKNGGKPVPKPEPEQFDAAADVDDDIPF